MAKNKPRGPDDEILFLIYLRRERAKATLNEILHGFREIPLRNPSPIQMVDYLSNMMFCLEMMHKLLSGDWFSHNIGTMYEKITGYKHANAALMTSIESSIKDQKYYLGPTSELVNHIPDMEGLYEEVFKLLNAKFTKFNYMVDIPLPDNFAQFLLSSVGRFYRRDPITKPRGMSLSDFHAMIAREQEAQQRDLACIRSMLGDYLAFGHKLSIFQAGGRALD